MSVAFNSSRNAEDEDEDDDNDQRNKKDDDAMIKLTAVPAVKARPATAKSTPSSG
jgi:hypothetical protein